MRAFQAIVLLASMAFASTAAAVAQVADPLGAEMSAGGRYRRGKGQNNKRGKGQRSRPKRRPNRLHISKRARRQHRRGRA